MIRSKIATYMAAALIEIGGPLAARAEQFISRPSHPTHRYQGRNMLATHLHNRKLNHDPLFGWKRAGGGGGGH